jgi:hypothetical protein
MTAVAQYLQDAGGSIHIEFLEKYAATSGFKAFAFIIVLPLSLFQIEASDSKAA